MVAGFYRGWVDTVHLAPDRRRCSRSRSCCWRSASRPRARSARAASAACIKPGLTVVIFVIAFVNWTYIARIIRGQVLSLREKEFVEAARSLGASNRASSSARSCPTWSRRSSSTHADHPAEHPFEAALSFLGVGVQPPNASWGQMIADATEIFDTAWWYMLFPGRRAASDRARVQPRGRRPQRRAQPPIRDR